MTPDDVKQQYRKLINDEVQVLVRQAYDNHYSNLQAEHRRFQRELKHLEEHRQLRLSALSEQKDS